MKQGMSVNTKEVCGLTPLDLAVINQQHDCCKYLVKAGAALLNPTISPYTLVVEAGGDTIETYREQRLRWKQAEKSDRFLGKIEGESSLQDAYLPRYHGR